MHVGQIMNPTGWMRWLLFFFGGKYLDEMTFIYIYLTWLVFFVFFVLVNTWLVLLFKEYSYFFVISFMVLHNHINNVRKKVMKIMMQICWRTNGFIIKTTWRVLKPLASHDKLDPDLDRKLVTHQYSCHLHLYKSKRCAI